MDGKRKRMEIEIIINPTKAVLIKEMNLERMWENMETLSKWRR